MAEVEELAIVRLSDWEDYKIELHWRQKEKPYWVRHRRFSPHLNHIDHHGKNLAECLRYIADDLEGRHVDRRKKSKTRPCNHEEDDL